MSKIELMQPINLFNNNNQCVYGGVQLPELGSLKRTKSDRVFLPSEPSKKTKSYFNAYNFSLDSIENNNCSLNNSSLDSSSDSAQDNFDNDFNKIAANPQQQLDTNAFAAQLEECSPSNNLNILQEEELVQQQVSSAQPIKLKSDIHFSPEGFCVNYEDRNYSNVFSEENQNVSMIIGYLCLTFAAVFFTFTLFSIFFAPFLEPTTHKLIDFLTNDKFYCFLIPLSLPVMCITIYMNWVSMKYFKHS